MSAPGSGERRFRLAVAALAVVAFGLSLGYVAIYLRGGPRIIDATSYFLQARALAEGHIAFPIPSPSGSFRGRFLLATPDASALAVIFPPGYPAVLALGFLAHAPMLVGPVLAAGLVVGTAALALRLFADRETALLAAALSTVCAVLRYHTADTMSHGWSALLLVVAVAASVGTSSPSTLLAGAASGVLVATRPMSGAVALGLVALGTWRTRGPRGALLAALGAAPPILLFIAQQRVVSGGDAWLASSQLRYYALADSPAGCFRYGFGSGIGCLFEHGDFVRAHLAGGYGFVAALGTTLRRLKMHLADAGNVELFAPLLVVGIVTACRRGDGRGTGRRLGLAMRNGRPAALGVVGVLLAYVPFYFDGNYPGGGARLLSDALPLEHVLLAAVLVRLRIARFAVPTALVGFALHTSYDHLRLRDREGGRPLFEDAVLAAAGVRRGLVFVETDHGFSLGHDPAVRGPETGVVVARRRHDAHDSILWERLGRPPTYSYELPLEVGAHSTARVVPLTLAPALALAPAVAPAVAPAAALTHPLRFEAEAEWPPLAVHGGSALPVFPACASGHRALAFAPSAGGGSVTVRVEVVAPRPGRYRLTTGWAAPLSAGTVDPTAGVSAALTIGGVTTPVVAPPPLDGCAAVVGPTQEIGKERVLIDISSGSQQVLDYLELSPG